VRRALPRVIANIRGFGDAMVLFGRRRHADLSEAGMMTAHGVAIAVGALAWRFFEARARSTCDDARGQAMVNSRSCPLVDPADRRLNSRAWNVPRRPTRLVGRGARWWPIR
jgi:hypothetical protein